MEYIKRLQQHKIESALARNKSVLLLGARQTGKTTLIQRLPHALAISFVRPDVRQRYEKNPALLIGEVEALTREKMRPVVILDEVQKVPDILDSVQDLVDRGKANFVLTGSSARKLHKRSQINFLAGRVIPLKLDPLTLGEAPTQDLERRLLYGALPGISLTENLQDRETDLQAYVTTYLEDEVRAEAIVRNLGVFARFIECAASESGHVVNFSKLSQEIGVSHTTIAGYYQILEDCLIAERIEPLTKSKVRKKLTKSEKYIFFDLGVRRMAAREGTGPSKESLGNLFEQFVGLELIRCCHLSRQNVQVRFWRDPGGPEVDWVLEAGDQYVPIEVKWTDSPTGHDAKHLKLFLLEYDNTRAEKSGGAMFVTC